MRNALLPSLVVVLAVVVSSCASTTPAGTAVRVTSNPEVVKGCKYLGEVKGKSNWGGLAAQKLGEENANRHLKESAAEMGANVVLLVVDHAGFSGSIKRGEAYFCSEQ